MAATDATAATAKIQFHYFDAIGRAEAVRIALNTVDPECWVDNRMTFQEYGAAKAEGKFKTGVPAMSLPSGKMYTQSVAQLRYAGTLAKLYPEDVEQRLAVDELLDICQDATTKCPQVRPEIKDGATDEEKAAAKEAANEKKKAQRQEYANGRLKDYLGLLESRYAENEGPFLVGTSLTIADLLVAFGLVHAIQSGSWDYIDPPYVGQFKGLSALAVAVQEHDIVKKHEAAQAARKAAKTDAEAEPAAADVSKTETKTEPAADDATAAAGLPEAEKPAPKAGRRASKQTDSTESEK